MEPASEGTPVLKGVWLYAGEVPCRITIYWRAVRYGSGDYEDPPEVRDDFDEDCFVPGFHHPADANPDRPHSYYGQFSTLDEARTAVEGVCGPTVRWDDPPRASADSRVEDDATDHRSRSGGP